MSATATNGVHKEWRDPTAAQLALLDRPAIERRKAIAGRMLRDGATVRDIAAATKTETGTAIGAGTLKRLRDEMLREAQREERRKAREASGKKPRAMPSKAAAPSEPPGWVRLPADPAVVAALLAAKVAFVFDGERISMKGGGK